LALTRLSALVVGVILVLSCAPVAERAQEQPLRPAASAETRTLVMSVRSEATTVAARGLIGAAFNVTPVELFNAGLAVKNQRGVPRPHLVEALPAVGTDSWKVSPDGRMETTYRLKANLTWHDGTALTASDFEFAWRVFATPELGAAGSPPFNQIENLLAPDARTVVIRWARPYPEAGSLEARDFQALPRHILDSPLRALPPDLFAGHGFWTTDYVGLGPYRIDRTEPGAFLEAAAFGGYVLGRPKISRIRVVYISDPNTVLVTGAVSRTSLVRFRRGLTAKDYVELAGGPTEKGDGDKTVTTGNAIDEITTGDGNDVINAGGGINTVKSGAGNDTITTGNSIDNIDGEDYFDTCNAGGGLNTVVNCEA